MNKRFWGITLGAGLALAASLSTEPASACGGFFCSQAQGVNQAAERIVFANNGDGTVTAVIEIQYQGPSDKFSWLLPISSVPMGDAQIQVGSSLSFQRLQQATNPQYSLTTRVEGTCDVEQGPSFGGSGGSASGFPSAEGGEAADSGVTVEATGHVGSFDWAVISLSASLSSPAAAAVEWLNDNGYDVPEGAPGLLGPYLEDGLYLLALKLEKGANAGSIRPIVLTYKATKPMIPIKLTAVAANDDMGVMTWLLGEGQAVPQNYYALELNEARINWFNPGANYNSVVIAAADEAGGQGFVTEYAQPASALGQVVFTDFDQSQWESFSAQAALGVTDEVLTNAMFTYSAWDGFWDVVRKHVQLPAGKTLGDVQDCPGCWTGYTVAPEFLAALQKDVIEPAKVLQTLLDTHPQVTRLYSTLSAAEMTVDPLFTFNPDLPAISNLHTAERVVECRSGYYFSEAPWRIELPQGGVIRGGPSTFGLWPAELDALPANRQVLRRGESGAGKVVEDNSTMIDAAISTYSASVPLPPRRIRFPGQQGPDVDPKPDDNSNPGAAVVPGDSALGGTGCGCSVKSRTGNAELALALLGVALAVTRRRRTG